MTDTSDAAVAYTAAGWAIVEFPTGTKGPIHSGWNRPERAITTPGEAEAITGNIGLCHAYSRTCAIDLDDLVAATAWLSDRGISAGDLLRAPTSVQLCSGRENRGKLLYRLPDGVEPLPSLKPAGSGLELRCATANGKTVQDVLPPSIHPVTQLPYFWAYGDDTIGHWSVLPELPAELLALWRSLLTPESKSTTPPQGIEADRLRGMLARMDPDCGYDTWIKVGMALHHETEGAEWACDLWDEWSSLGTKYVSEADVRGHWPSFGGGKGRQVTVNWLMSQAGAVGPEDFDDLTDLPTPPPKRKRFEHVTLDAFSAGAPPSWLVKGVLADAGLGILYGESGAGKSFVILDMMACIARGIPWNGKRVRQGRVTYVCAEGQGGFRNRIRAYCQHSGVNARDLAIGVVADIPNLLTEDHKMLAERVVEWGSDLVVIDTLAQTTPGGAENSSEDMGKALMHCRALHAATGAMVLLVHHSGKDATKGARGWSGMKAAADSELELTRDGDNRFVRVSKQKDGEDGLEFAFRLPIVSLGEDIDGDPVTSCVVEWLDVEQARASREPSGPWQRAVWHAALAAIELADDGASVEVVVASAIEGKVVEPGKRDKRREHATRALNSLISAGWLRMEGGFVLAKNNK